MISNTEIAFIGAGKIAHSLVPALTEKGFQITHLISRNIDSALKLTSLYNISNYSDDLNILKDFSGIVFLSLPDKSIEETANKLSTLDLNFKKCIFIHLAGAFDSSILSSLSVKGGAIASMHIMQTFPSSIRVDINGTYAAIESDSPEVYDTLNELAKKIGMHTFRISKEEKTKYHIAAVYASNFINALLYGSSELINGIQGLPGNPIELFQPIIMSTLNNIMKMGPINGLSGPIERGDFDTIKKHLKELKEKHKSLLPGYITLSILLLETANKKHFALHNSDLPNNEEIKKLLNKELHNYNTL